MKRNIFPPEVPDGEPVQATCSGGFPFTSSRGKYCYRVVFVINDDKGRSLKVNKVFIEDYSDESEFRQFLDGLSVISEDGDFDDASLIGKEVEIILRTGTFNDEPQREVEQIIIL